MNIPPVGAELFHADGQPDGRRVRHDEERVAFRNFAKAPKERGIYRL
jgi:hypothetical protein